MAETSWSSPVEAAKELRTEIPPLLSRVRNVQINDEKEIQTKDIPCVIRSYAAALHRQDRSLEAQALEIVLEKVTQSPSYGGLGLISTAIPTSSQYAEVLFLISAHLESVTSTLNSRNFLSTAAPSQSLLRPMTLAQKIFLQHALSGVSHTNPTLSVGDVIRTGVDWVIASELSWKGMEQTYASLGSPGIWRNDRFWIAGDHVVHPSIRESPKIKAYVESAEKAKRDFRMTEFQGMNYTIMHTEFVRERAEPGMLVLGSDSHTCSAGAVGCLSIGLGAADVMMALSLGETWFKIPESVMIEFVGEPSFGILGKDVILHVLKVLKRNTVAAERIVEFVGEGVRFLSVDARFAICNMCTEFGAITGVFVPDGITKDYIDRRKRKANKSSSVYFCPDPDAVYAEKCTVDLAAVEPSIAVYPNPDDVVPVSEKEGMQLDGVFIGACTTTEEELVLGALILKAGLKRKLPRAKGKRHYVPGSLPIVERLRGLGLLEVYEEAGFTRGPPGCSMCVGLSAEKAEAGETWLSSQNRNFENRMGKGSFGHLSSAVVCAASSFSMTVSSPAMLLQDLDFELFRQYRNSDASIPEVAYSEPSPYHDDKLSQMDGCSAPVKASSADNNGETDSAPNVLRSKVITLGDFIDTDALSPGFTLTSCTTDAEFGEHVLCHTYPSFRSQVRSGQRIVVGGHAFGVGSSRESAVSALKGAGVIAVIARSFAFIYGRNQPSLGLLGIVMEDEGFYEAAKDGEEIVIDLKGRWVDVRGTRFGFRLSEMEERLTRSKGIARAYGMFGKGIWEVLMSRQAEEETGRDDEAWKKKREDGELDW